MKFETLIFILLFSLQVLGASEMYRLLEDPHKGPVVLRGWKILEPISEEKWDGIVGDHLKIPYVVKPGDSLSKISKELLGSEDYWPKLWEVNKEKISNPHLIEPNQTIIFNIPREMVRNTASVANLEVAPEKKIVEEEKLVSSSILSRHQLRYFFLEDESILGIVTGSYENKNRMQAGDDLYIGSFDKSKLQTGRTYKIIREINTNQLKTLPKGTEILGTLMGVVGEVRINQYGDDLARATVTGTYVGVERGDRVVELDTLDLEKTVEAAPSNLISRIILGENLENDFFFRGQLVLLDKGRESGMKPGYLFRVFEDTDPLFDNQKLVEPRSKGEVKVVKVGKTYSVGYILKSRGSLQRGDALVAADQLANNHEGPGTFKSTSYLD